MSGERLLIAEENGALIVFLDGEPEARALVARGSPVDAGRFEKTCSIVGRVALDIAAALNEAKDHTKEIEVEVAFELTSGFALKIVDLSSKASMKLKLKL